MGSLETKLTSFWEAVHWIPMAVKSFLNHAKMFQFVSTLLKRLLIMSVFPCTYDFSLVMNDFQKVKPWITMLMLTLGWLEQ